MANYPGRGHYGGRDDRDGGGRYDGSRERLDSYTATEVTEDSYYSNSYYGSKETLDDDRSYTSSNKPPPQPRRFRPTPQQSTSRGPQDQRRDSPPNYNQYAPKQPPAAQPGYGARGGYGGQARSPSPSEYSESQYSQSQYSQSQYSQSQYSQSQYSQSQYSEQARPAPRGRGGRYPQQAPEDRYRGAPVVHEEDQESYREGSVQGGYRGGGRQYQAPSVSSQGQSESTVPRTHFAPKVKYSQRPYYQQKSGKPKTKSIVKVPSFYNHATDTILHTKKSRKGFILGVAKPYAKNYHQGARDFLPVAVASLMFNPIVGWVPLAFALMARRANLKKQVEKASYLGKTAFMTAIACFLITILFFIAMLSVTQSGAAMPPRLH